MTLMTITSTIAAAVLLTGLCVLMLCVRIIFGRKKEFLRGHACGGVRHHSATENKPRQ